MATKLYLCNADAFYTPATIRGTWNSSSSAAVGHLGRNTRNQSSANFLAETSATNPFARLLGRWVSDRLKAQTISGTLDFMMLMRESDAAANMSTKVHVYVTTGDSDTPRGTLLSNHTDGTEFQVHASQHGAVSFTSVAISSLAVSDGDRLVIEVGYSAANAVTTSYTGSIKYGGDTPAVGTETTVTSAGAECPWIQFSGTVTFLDTYLYLVTDASPVTPGATRGTWNDTASAIDKYLSKTLSSGARASLAIAETVSTNPYDVLFMRWVSDQLAAQTIDGTLYVTFQSVESNAAADAFGKIHVYVMASDGSVRGTLLSNQVGSTELSSGVSNRMEVFTLSGVSALDTDRIVIEMGARFTNSVTTSYTVTMYYGGNSGIESAMDGGVITGQAVSWHQFRDEILWYTPAATSRSFVPAIIG